MPRRGHGLAIGSGSRGPCLARRNMSSTRLADMRERYRSDQQSGEGFQTRSQLSRGISGKVGTQGQALVCGAEVDRSTKNSLRHQLEKAILKKLSMVSKATVPQGHYSSCRCFVSGKELWLDRTQLNSLTLVNAFRLMSPDKGARRDEYHSC
jgi:hypothetical protein